MGGVCTLPALNGSYAHGGQNYKIKVTSSAYAVQLNKQTFAEFQCKCSLHLVPFYCEKFNVQFFVNKQITSHCAYFASAKHSHSTYDQGCTAADDQTAANSVILHRIVSSLR